MLKLQLRIFIAFLLFILLPILVLGIVSYHVSSSTLKNNLSGQTLQTLKAIDLNLQTSFASANTFSDYVISSQETHDFLKSNNLSFIHEFYRKRRALAGVMFGNSKVDDYILYSNSGNVIHFKNTPVPSFEQIKIMPFFYEMIEQKGRPVWLDPTENVKFTKNDQHYLSQGRVIKDPNNLNNIGYLIIHMKLDLLDQIYQKLHQTNSQELIINQEGKILYNFNHDLIGQTLKISNIENIISGKEGAILGTWKGEKSLITFYPSHFDSFSQSKVILVSIKPWKALSQQIDSIRNTTLLLVIIGTVLAILFNVIFLKQILVFLKEFVQKMKIVETGDLTTRMRIFKFYELENLAIGFNKMIEQIGWLLQSIKNEQEQKRNAEFQVLQQQINPHFLYNTLESINSLAALNGQREISRMTINLGKLLRIGINGAFEVKVKDEIRHVLSYLEIQKVRYNNRFRFEIDVEERLDDYLVLKLILQPLVENALNHAFNQQTAEGLIRIKGMISKNQGCIFIEDNGTGFSQDVLNTLSQSDSKEKESMKTGGHGIRNVQERLKLYYGNRYGLMICSMNKKGSIIKISFPLYKGDKDATKSINC